MNSSDKMDCISPIKMSSQSKFKFRCHSQLKCFTLCCRGISITLTPYDIIQLKNRLNLSSREFLALYTIPHLLEKTDLPMLTLKPLDDKQESCPFVKNNEGCILYEDRPTSCRYYPLGSATLQHKEEADDSDFFFLVNEPHCTGFFEKQEWTVKEWLQDQGLNTRDEVNNQWTELIVRKRSFPTNIKLTEQAKQMFFLVSYDIDKFREFIFNSSFLKRFSITPKTKNKINENEIELLKFGLGWLKTILFKTKEQKEQELASTQK